MAIKCHSGFVHYNMFHNNHCHGGGNNYGSIFNITNNCDGGCGGGFWGGFGAGLGLGFGNLLGGLFGGFMGGFGNMFGGFGMGGLGFGGFGGFGGLGGWGNSLSSLWGGGNNAGERDYSEYSSRRSSRRSSSCDCGCEGKGKEVKDFEDPDNKKIVDLRDKIRAKDVTKEQLEGYVKELDELKSKGLTDNYKHDKDVEELGIDALLSEANTKLKNLGQENPVAQGNQAKIGNKPISGLTVNDIAGINEDAYGKLDDDAKRALKEKVYNLAKEDQAKAKEWAQSKTLPSDLRAEAKRSFYEEGYTNVTLETLTNEEIKKLKSVIDTSEIDDFRNINTITEISRDDNGNLKSFKMTAQSGTSVTYATVEVVDGELIFHGKKADQEYALQKDKGENYHLMQYAYHKGNGTADVSSNS